MELGEADAFSAVYRKRLEKNIAYTLAVVPMIPQPRAVSNVGGGRTGAAFVGHCRLMQIKLDWQPREGGCSALGDGVYNKPCSDI